MVACSHGDFTCNVKMTNRDTLGKCAINNRVTVPDMTNPST
jgi:hypothetical protein